MSEYESFAVLLDEPSRQPALNVDEISRSLAEIAAHSYPNFAIGVFGSWGAGKTTLMSSIREWLEPNAARRSGNLVRGEDDVVTVWFNAWRYEREPHLIVPLLDELRLAIARRAATTEEQKVATSVARRLGRAARAILAGVKLRASIPGVSAEFDPAAAMNSYDANAELDETIQSFYFAAFSAMRDAVREYTDSGKRVVIFVDDLDRCLPEKALEVLESMKLFFDQKGFVFVVGLDHDVIVRAIGVRYREGNELDAPATRRGEIAGRDYIKKIFQVPYVLPRVDPDQLDEYYRAVLDEAGFASAQRAHLDEHVLPHLQYLVDDSSSVNPREVKRLINAYILQMKILSSTKFKDPDSPDGDVVLALQLMTFRRDWERVYEQLAIDPDLVRELLNDPEITTISLGSDEVVVPASLRSYLNGPAGSVLGTLSLGAYVSSVESTRTPNVDLLEAQRDLRRLYSMVEELSYSPPDTGSPVSGSEPIYAHAERLLSRADALGGTVTSDVPMRVEQLNALVRGLSPELDATEFDRRRQEILALVREIDASLSSARRLGSIGGLAEG